MTTEYPSFSRRLGAWLLDYVVLYALAMPIVIRGIWSLDFEQAALATFGAGLGSYAYLILTQAFWGQTIGKLALGICLRMKDGTAVKWPSVLIRYLPDLAGSVLYSAGWLLTVRSAGWVRLQGLAPAERRHLLNMAAPFWWPGLASWSMVGWHLANAIVLWKNAQNRALHDLLAGTTVRRASN